MDARSGVRPKATADEPGAPPGESGTGSRADGRQGDEFSELLDEARHVATETASNAGNVVRQRIDEQYRRLGRSLEDLIKNLDQAADSLDRGGSAGAANLMHGAGRQMERVSGYVQKTSVDEVASDVNQYARQHPWAVIVGGVVVGLMASRFLKAAMPSDEGGQAGGGASDRAPGAGYESGTSYHVAV